MAARRKRLISKLRALFNLILEKSLTILTASKIRVTRPAYPCFNAALSTTVIFSSSVGNKKNSESKHYFNELTPKNSLFARN